ncbi:MAG: class I SAM-dependent methyltransferase family protein [Methanobacterium sp.]|uniref:class I SAM-dependent methyltransferase n=1 Tax=Methanobacterium sp. TaxID=2164 RepID=UPI003D647394|nr:class I SAM-dependent methyltransferase family protein [Methanobacterium sp.]
MKGKVIGDILVLKNEPNNLDELLKLPEVNRIVKLGRISGSKREPDVKILVGDNTETIHRENHCFFKLDVAKIMWSKGNTTERKRIAELVEDGEIIVDMFAGIGYFSIPIAVHSNPQKIYSIEINPISYCYLKENIVLNKVEGIINPLFGDCRKLAPKGIADRVLMGYIGNTHEYLDVAMEIVKPGGIIHYHESVPDKLKFERPPQRIIEAANGRDVEILNKRIIKKYSPGVYHVVIDALIE